MSTSIQPEELAQRIASGDPPAILDVRSAAEFARGHVPGAMNVPFTQVGRRIAEIPGRPDDEIVVYCGHGPRAYIAAATLRRHGRLRVRYLAGHWARWPKG